MKKILSLLLCTVLLTGCGSTTVAEVTAGTQEPSPASPANEKVFSAPVYESRFDTVTEIILSDDSITLNDNADPNAVFPSRDIIYYEDRDQYDSGNPYGEGTDADKHTPQEAASHTVVNITQPGAYQVTGKLSAGQIRVDLGDDAYEDPDAVVELILQDADITCTVAPAILFLNTYECDGSWSADSAKAEVVTSGAGANLILEGNNTVNGSYVAKIFKDKDEEKKLWKQDGAIYSYMSMNVFGPGALELNAANEGLDTELHLTINGGSITINSDNDGINTNEDGVSVTTINGGNLTIFAGLGAEGDGIDSNGYLVINGGTVVSSANPAADAGLDSDLGSFINGGTVIAFGSTMDWAESNSGQVTMNLQFASQQAAGSKITVTGEDGTERFSFESDTEYDRPFSGMILSHASFTQGETYHVCLDDIHMAYTGTDVGRGRPGGMQPGTPPEGFDPAQIPEGFEPGQMDGSGPRPGKDSMTPPEGFKGEPPAIPQDTEHPEWPDGKTFPMGEFPRGNRSQSDPTGDLRIDFYMNDMVNSFSGVTAAA